jgi:hypothetical protein
MYPTEYPAVYYETKVGVARGFETPITIGLSQNASEGLDVNFTEVHMTQRGADDAAFAFLGVAWGRYKNLMGHPDITIDEYLGLLREGKGNIEIYDAITQKSVLVDPRQGFALVITGDKNSNMPLRCYDDPGYYWSSDEKGRLVYASNAAYINYHLTLEAVGEPGARSSSMFVYSEITPLVLLVTLPSSTLKNGGNANACGLSGDPPYVIDMFGQLGYDERDFFQNDSVDPLFTLH